MRFAARQLRRRPSPYGGCDSRWDGANTAVFSVVDSVILRPLPFRDSGRLVSFKCGIFANASSDNLDYPTFFDLRERNRTPELNRLYRSDHLF